MDILQEAIEAEQDFEIDLTEFQLEGEMNDMYASRGFPQRITCHWNEDKTFMKIMLRDYIQAIYHGKILYKVGAMQLQWMLIQRAFKNIYKDLQVYE